MNSGFLYINKPAGITSHGVISRLRKITGEKRIGHAGTLDPFATGLLIVAVTRDYTKLLDQWLKKDKSYRATLTLGYESTTGDPEGDLTPISNKKPSESEIKVVLERFTGKIEQIPPKYSAIKINGKRAYELARKGEEVTIQPREVTIYSIELIRYNYPNLEISVSVSSGTYIRTLGEDIGKKLETGAYLIQLERTSIDHVKLEEAVELDDLNEGNWRGVLRAK